MRQILERFTDTVNIMGEAESEGRVASPSMSWSNLYAETREFGSQAVREAIHPRSLSQRFETRLCQQRPRRDSHKTCPHAKPGIETEVHRSSSNRRRRTWSCLGDVRQDLSPIYWLDNLESRHHHAVEDHSITVQLNLLGVWKLNRKFVNSLFRLQKIRFTIKEPAREVSNSNLPGDIRL